MGFQSVIEDFQAPAVAGDFASMNPFSSILAGPGALVAPAGGLIVGNFAWVGPAGQVSQSFVSGYQVGFLGRNMQALITEFLGEATMVVPEGFMVTLFNTGDFWANFEAGATVGGYVFADPNDGAPVYASTNSAPTLGAGTATAGYTGTGTVVNLSAIITINTVTHGFITPGDAITGTDIPANTTILNQLTGNAGGTGTYTMSAAATGSAGPEAVVVISPLLIVTAIASGGFNFGDVISGTGIPAGTTVDSQAAPFSGVATVGTLPSTPSTALNVTSVTPGSDLLRVGATITGAGIAAATTIASQTSGTPGGVGVYVMSQNSTAEAAGVPITTSDSVGGTGAYTTSGGPIAAGTASAPTTVSVTGTAQATGFRVRGVFSPPASGANVGGQLAKISSN